MNEQRLVAAFDSVSQRRSPADIARMGEQRDEIVAILESASEPLVRKKIGDEMDISKSTLKRRIRSLRDVGRVETTDGPDGRRTYYQVTEADDGN